MMFLVIKKCNFDLDEIAPDLKLSSSQYVFLIYSFYSLLLTFCLLISLSMYCRQLGCDLKRIKTQGEHKSVKADGPLRVLLVVPLKFPSAKKGGRK